MRITKFGAGMFGLLALMMYLIVACGREPTDSSPPSQTTANPQSVSPTPQEAYNPKIGTYGGRIVLSQLAGPKGFNPVIAQETSTTAVTQYIFEGLTRVSGITNEVEPALAKGWEVSEDGLTWTIYLREDVKWNDGVRFTADDVVFTYEQLVYNKDIPSSSRDIFTIEGKEFEVTKVDEFTVTFRTPVIFAPFLRGLAQEILPKHVLEKSVREGTFNSTWGVDSRPETIVGTGPFMLERYESGQRVLLKRNPYYWKTDAQGNRLPYLDGIIILIVPDLDVALLKFQEGELDVYGLRGTDYPKLKPLEQQKGFTVYRTGPDFGTNFVVFNQNPEKNPETGRPYLAPKKLKWFTNVKFRQAVAYALDRQGMIDTVLNGLGYPQYSPLSPSAGFFYNPDVVKYPYDPERARKLLAETGFSDKNGDGFVEDPAGNTVEFNLYTNAENTVRMQIASIIKDDLEEIGMKVNFTALEFNNIVDKLMATFDWEGILLGLTGGTEPHFAKNVWHSSGQLHEWYPRQKKPATEWEARIDEIFEQAVQTLDRQERKRLYDEWQLIVSQQVPVIYTVLPEVILAVRNRFGNLYPTAFGGALHNIEEMYIVQP
ncbi:MAG: ABC transporter substrate-binding protein [Candidatus Abyssubacteria bacterium]